MTGNYSFIADISGVRLDRFVGERCPELSRTHAQKLIADDLITVNGLPAKSSLKLEVGDRVDVIIPPESPPDLTPEDIPLDIVYEDADLLVENTETGQTIARHNLKIIDTLFKSTACLVGSKNIVFNSVKGERISSIIEALQAAVEDA